MYADGRVANAQFRSGLELAVLNVRDRTQRQTMNISVTRFWSIRKCRFEDSYPLADASKYALE
jgi:hypothetical protein